MIAWKYIDKPSAAISALQDYANMRSVINITPDEIKELYNRMISPRGTKITDMPKTKNNHRHEDMLVASMDKLDAMQERYRQAIEYMGWFEPAWGYLWKNLGELCDIFTPKECYNYYRNAGYGKIKHSARM